MRIRNTEYGLAHKIQITFQYGIRIRNTEYGMRTKSRMRSIPESKYRMQNAEFFPSKQVALKCRILFRIRNTNAEYGMVPKNTLSFQNRGLSMQNFQSIMETGSLTPHIEICRMVSGLHMLCERQALKPVFLHMLQVM